MDVTAILDVGKTNVKLALLDDSGTAVWSRSRANRVLDTDPYPHFDVEGIWQWLLLELAEAAGRYCVRAINVSTHGACAVLVDEEGGLALPVLDYEFDGVEACNERYEKVRPPFSQTLSPALPHGLNLGRQLCWLRENFPGQFARAKHLLMYPQYWVWRLTGVAATEVTSLGCHTDLWQPGECAYSSLVDELGIRAALPAMVYAADTVGVVRTAVAVRAALPADCAVYAGVHDSNASFARSLAAGISPPFAVVSTGTWVITMAAGASLDRLDPARDTLANVDVLGRPLACARFMGGREFDEICRRTSSSVDDECDEDDIAALVSGGKLPLPAFSEEGGPFLGREGSLPADVDNGKALATLYLALLIDYELDLLDATGDIVFGSASQKNVLLCRLLAQLRPGQRVLLSGDDASTVRGAWSLTRAGFPKAGLEGAYAVAEPARVAGLPECRAQWLEAVTSR
jgi:sugar (pentulose or hexulose) kinase